jgi:hypothetical protein
LLCSGGQAGTPVLVLLPGAEHGPGPIRRREETTAGTTTAATAAASAASTAAAATAAAGQAEPAAEGTISQVRTRSSTASFSIFFFFVTFGFLLSLFWFWVLWIHFFFHSPSLVKVKIWSGLRNRTEERLSADVASLQTLEETLTGGVSLLFSYLELVHNKQSKGFWLKL